MELSAEAVRKAAKLVKDARPREGARTLQDALESDPKAARLHLELAIILHEWEKDYIGAAYHYRKYLSLRPGSEKRALIEDRLMAAMQLLAASVAGGENAASTRVQDLERKNESLAARNKALEDELNRAKQKRRIAVDSPASNTLAGADTDTRVTKRGGFRHYTVKRGDSLSSIAVKMYGDPHKWEQVYEANRKELENSNDLKIGQVLIIP